MAIDSQTICPLPFLQLFLHPSGHIYPCCFLQELPVGDAVGGLAGAWNGPAMRRLRSEFAKGTPYTCARHMKEVGCHKFWAHLLPLIEESEIQKSPPRRLHLSLSGRCNLRCIMCDVDHEASGKYETSDLWTMGRTGMFRNLVEVTITGGEPFIQPETFRLIEDIASVNSSVAWYFVTNGQWEWSSQVVNCLTRLNSGEIIVSIDSLKPEVYREIRKGGRLERTIRTLEQLVSYSRERNKNNGNLVVMVAMCVQVKNWREVPAFIRFAESYDVWPILQYAYGPPDCSLSSLAVETRREALQSFVSLRKGNYYDSELGRLIAPLQASFG